MTELGPRPTWSPPADSVQRRSGIAMGAHLMEIHQHLRGYTARLLLIIDEVERDRARIGDARAAVAELTQQRGSSELGSYCAGYCALVTQHHMLEDRAVFPGLSSADSGLAVVVDRLMAEHDVVAEGLSRIDAALVAVESGAGELDELRLAAASLAEMLISHLDYEEEQLLPAFAIYW